MKLAERLLSKLESEKKWANAPIYTKFRNNPIKVKVEKDVSEVIFDLASVMLDNKYRMGFIKKEGKFKIRKFGQSFSNFQIKNYGAVDLEWLADEGKWQKIVDIINSGTSVVSGYKQR